MEKVIEVENLSFRYGDQPIFSGIGFAVARGDFVALIGANGAGKSTLMRLILHEAAAREGGVRLFGEDARTFRGWPRIGYLPQNAMRMGAGFPASVREIVEASLYAKTGPFRRPGRQRRAAAAAALRQVGMAEYADRLIGELSGGQQQRVMLARVLAAGPEVMILDEPTVGIDAAAVEALYRLLAQLNRDQGLTILMVTHDVAGASAIATRVLCLEEGTLVELERRQVAAELAHRHKHPAPGEHHHGHATEGDDGHL
ncbi:MAG: metal ABC transporter ATP-binding protein [Clostridiales bacterium]|nr:metal ABC transporter ATP-binding protein [Clostridiales bacterium]